MSSVVLKPNLCCFSLVFEPVCLNLNGTGLMAGGIAKREDGKVETNSTSKAGLREEDYISLIVSTLARYDILTRLSPMPKTRHLEYEVCMTRHLQTSEHTALVKEKHYGFGK
ncbi:hypothetical protein CR513_26688, partial [Mucuna pruriens]